MKLFKDKYKLARITKELVGMQRPTNAPYFAKLAMSKAVGEKLDIVFSGFDNVIVLPAKIKEVNKYDGKKLFQIKYKNFDENSLCVVVKYISLNCLKEVADDILNQFR